MAKNTGLGRGLDAIFSENDLAETASGVRQIRLTMIEPKADQPRKKFDTEALAQLADSIAQNGVLQPILVRESANGFYQIIAGERRWRASKLAGLSEIPALVIEADELKAAQVALIENIQREDLNAQEEAEAYRMLMDEYGLTQEEVAKQLGKSRSAVANALRLLDLPESVLGLLRSGELSAGHARALLGLKDRSDMQPLAEKIVRRSLSVREAENAVRQANRASGRPVAESETGVTVDYFADLSSRATSLSGHRVSVSGGAKKSIRVEYTNDDDLMDILRRLCGAGIDEKQQCQ